ncbi:dTMP kinase [Georgenia sp. Z1344]|uniref:dTMP kinase n=1 Tax=Georgenia sp. Z1344 TaxID=3416706 RepID=UPI003CF291AC
MSAPVGLLISLEGGDGAGKSTQQALLLTWLVARGREAVATREPGGTPLGAEIRRLILHGEHVDPRAEALLYAADRAHHVASLVRPALERGAVVVTDRFVDSSVAYQGAARDLGPGEVRDLSAWATGGLTPDLTILLDVDPTVAAARRGGEPDRLERAGDAFHLRVREEFLRIAAAEPDRVVVVDAAGTPDEVHARVRVAVERVLGGAAPGAVPGADADTGGDGDRP